MFALPYCLEGCLVCFAATVVFLGACAVLFYGRVTYVLAPCRIIIYLGALDIGKTLMVAVQRYEPMPARPAHTHKHTHAHTHTRTHKHNYTIRQPHGPCAAKISTGHITRSSFSMKMSVDVNRRGSVPSGCWVKSIFCEMSRKKRTGRSAGLEILRCAAWSLWR